MPYELNIICDTCGKRLDALVKVMGAEGLEFHIKPHTCRQADKENHTRDLLNDKFAGLVIGTVHGV